MRIKLGSGLLALNLLVIVLIVAIVLISSDPLRIIIGFPFLIFFPGYVLILALFPRKEMGGIERVALSFGLSITVVPLIGLILNYTAWGITLESTLYSVASFILAMSIIAMVRRRRLDEHEKFDIAFQMKVPGWGGGAWDKLLSVVLVVSILGALGTLGYVIANPKIGEKFTEFYILGLEGEAADYPSELKIGETGMVMVGIINHEQGDISYHVEIRSDDTLIGELGSVILYNDEEWEQRATFTPVTAGENQKIEFLLFREGDSEPYNQLHLWVDVNE